MFPRVPVSSLVPLPPDMERDVDVEDIDDAVNDVLRCADINTESFSSRNERSAAALALSLLLLPLHQYLLDVVVVVRNVNDSGVNEKA